MPLESAPALRNGDAAFQQHCPQLIDQRGPFAHQSIASPMQCLHVELFLALQLDKSHRRSRCRLRNRFCIAIVVLLRLDIGADILR